VSMKLVIVLQQPSAIYFEGSLGDSNKERSIVSQAALSAKYSRN
jgi:hypothetical protein